jgi:saccharopine dehydrogenase (NAD+, L-lysine-forming)
MKILQLGVGAVGEVIARTIATEDAITKVVLADIDAKRVGEVAGKIGGKAASLPLDVADTAALKRALADADFVVNALVPRFNTGIMRACLETGTNYLDMAGDNDMDDEIALDEQFRRAGLTALVFFGIDPGASDVFARCLYDQFDTVESLTVLDGDNATVDGYEIVASFSPATMIEEVAASPPGFVDGVMTLRESMSVANSFEFDFPAPVGRLRVWNTDHEESVLMPRYLAGKGLRNANFFIALDDHFMELVRVVHTLGLDSREPVEFGGGRFAPLDFIASRLPRAVDLYGKMHGHVCVGALAEGTIGGKPARRYMHQITSHDEAFAKMGVQGTGYQTGLCAACAVIMWAQGHVKEKGVLAPERVDPQPYLDLMSKHGVPWKVVDLPA